MSKKPITTTEIDPTGQVSKSVVYSADNIAKSATAKAPDYAKMSVDKLGSTIAKAKNKAELNQVKIMNQPISMGVITGQAAHMAAINNAQINSLSNIWDAKNTELAREEAAKQQKFTNDLALKNYNLNVKNTMSEIAARGKPKAADTLATYGAGLTRGEGGFVDYAKYQQAKDASIKSGTGLTGSDFDSAYGSMLSPDDQKKFGIGLTPFQAQAGAKPATQAQYLAAGYATRTEEANNLINNLSGYASGANPAAFAAQGFAWTPNFLKSSEFQQYDQASRNFINAVLRRESGAAIAPSEFQNAYQQYLPQPGDKPDVLENKRKNREMVIANLAQSAGQAYSGNALRQDNSQLSDQDAYAEYLKLIGQ